MADVFLAFLRSLISLTRPRLWRMLLAPALFAFFFLLVLAFWGRQPLVVWLTDSHPIGFLFSRGWSWLAQVLVFMASWITIFAVAYFTSVFLAAVLIMPWLLEHVAVRDYPDVLALGKDSFSAAVANSVLATFLLVGFWLISLPLWLIPGVAIILPILLLAWYNRRTFAYDALSLHATGEEWSRIRHECRRGFFLIGLFMAILAYVPFLGLLVPTLGALTFIHYGLEMLRRLRGVAPAAEDGQVIIEGEFSEVQ